MKIKNYGKKGYVKILTCKGINDKGIFEIRERNLYERFVEPIILHLKAKRGIDI